jgi:predicted ATPase
VLERGREAPSTLEELSAGTRQMLLLAALYVHSAPPALILLEEPDSGMHVGALSALRDLLRSLSARSVVVATSHSPAFVSLLDAEKEVVVLERGDERIDARSLARARESKQWLAQFESPFEAFVREGMSR